MVATAVNYSMMLRLARPVLLALGRVRQHLPRWMRRPGVLGIVLTPGGDTVLVRHSYMTGWFPPGGGRKRGESAQAAVIRELREEIGLRGWSSIDPIQHGETGLDIFVVRDATYLPGQSLEIAEVGAFPPHRLPPRTSPRLHRLFAAGLVKTRQTDRDRRSGHI